MSDVGAGGVVAGGGTEVVATGADKVVLETGTSTSETSDFVAHIEKHQ